METDNTIDENISWIVDYHADKFYHKLNESIAFEDLHDAGRDGWKYAIKYFDASKGKSWRGFATMCIRQRIMDFISKKGKKHFNNEYFCAHELSMTGITERQFIKASNQYNSMLLDDNTEYMDSDKQEYLSWLLESSDLDEREKQIINYRLQNMVFREISELFNITTERIRQIVKQGTEKMIKRHKLEQWRVMYE